MRTFARFFAVVCAGVASTVQALEPVIVSDGVIIEQAWARVDAAGITEIFLVVNNQSAGGATLGIKVPGATDVQVVGASGRPIRPSIPMHSELYMEPDGVRIVATGLSPSSTVPVEVTVGNRSPVVIQAELLTDGQAAPDHHDYQHG